MAMRATRILSRSVRSGANGSTHFGFRDIPMNEKQGLVGEVFARVASRYDVMNDVMSGFLHRTWKDSFVSDMRPTSGMSVLDCAGGTGDIALRIVDRAPDANVTVLDVSGEMLKAGKAKAEARKIPESAMRFIEGNAENLPFPDDSFDIYAISFGMRNVPRPVVAVQEAMRVLRPGGRFMMLEFALVRNEVLRQLYDAYSFNVIPAMGQAVAGDRASYQYLVESIRKFPKQEEFLGIMRDAGFASTSVTDYTNGVAASYSGFKNISPKTKQ